MASTEPSAIIERLLDDDYVHEQVAAAGAGLRDAYRRARRLPPEKAVQDQTLYDHLRRSASGVASASRRIAGKPPPEPPRRRRGPLLLVILAAAVVVVFAAKSRSQTQASTETGGPEAAPGAPGNPPVSGP